MQPTKSNTATRTKSRTGTQPVAQQGWKRLSPNTEPWLDQAYQRYSDSVANLNIAAARLAKDQWQCFVCGETRHLADYTVNGHNGDKTQTFRYCRACAATALETGAHIRLDRTIEDPEEPEEEEEYEAHHATRALPLSQLVGEKVGRERRRWHPMTYIGLTFFICVVLYTLFVAGPPFVQNKWNDVAYQSPRISQTDVTTLSGAKLHLVLQNEAGSIVLIAEPMPINPATFKSVVVVKVLDASLVPTATSDGTTIFVTVGQFLETVDVAKLLPASTK